MSIIEEHYGVEEPLIWTLKGNLPLASLRYEYGWIDNDEQVSFHERYWLGDELVKEGAHVKLKKPAVEAAGEAGGFLG